MIKKTMLILATVGTFALMNGSAFANGAGTDCEFKPTIEKLAVGKDKWICRVHRDGGRDGGRDSGRDSGRGEGQGSSDS